MLTLPISDWLFHSEGEASCDWAVILNIAFFPIQNYTSDMSWVFYSILFYLIKERYSFMIISEKPSSWRRRAMGGAYLSTITTSKTHTFDAVSLTDCSSESVRMASLLLRSMGARARFFWEKCPYKEFHRRLRQKEPRSKKFSETLKLCPCFAWEENPTL